MEERDSTHAAKAYKPAVEIAEEEAINTVLATNEYHLTRARVNQDLVNIGIGITKTSFNPAEGIVVDYVDPCLLCMVLHRRSLILKTSIISEKLNL